MAPGAYAWWCLDALSDDGHHALVAIIFIGSVFSPYYARARARAAAGAGGLVDAQQHVAINVALYRTDGGPGARWALTERGASALQRSASQLTIGPSQLQWDGSALLLQLDERTAPIPRRLRGTVRLHLAAAGSTPPFNLDRAGQHRWWPIAPIARVEVDLQDPAWCWRGAGYLDSNRGALPLEASFQHWQWARAALGSQQAAVVYDAQERSGAQTHLALHFEAGGSAQPLHAQPVMTQAFNAPLLQPLPRSLWAVPRSQRSEAGAPPLLHTTLEDMPFYARSLVQARWLGQPVLAMHESLRLDRFAMPWVQAMLPFRMPRRAG